MWSVWYLVDEGSGVKQCERGLTQQYLFFRVEIHEAMQDGEIVDEQKCVTTVHAQVEMQLIS